MKEWVANTINLVAENGNRLNVGFRGHQKDDYVQIHQNTNFLVSALA